MNLQSGRSAYTAIEDRAIIKFIKEHSKDYGPHSIKGNALYKRMEQEKVTGHPWQSMRSRYLKIVVDSSTRFKFHQMIKAKSRDKEIPVLTHPSRKSELNGGIELRSRRHRNQQKPPDRAQKDNNAPSSDCTSKSNKIIEFCATSEGRKKLRLILIERKVKEFMLKFNLNFMEALKAIYSVNGDLEEAEYYVQHGKKRDGSKLFSREEDEIMLEGDKDKLSELSRIHGNEVVSAHFNFIRNIDQHHLNSS